MLNDLEDILQVKVAIIRKMLLYRHDFDVVGIEVGVDIEDNIDVIEFATLIDDGQINEVKYEVDDNGMVWGRVEWELDTGANEWVIRRSTASAIPVLPSSASKAGIDFAAANGTVIRNYGQKMLPCFDDN